MDIRLQAPIYAPYESTDFSLLYQQYSGIEDAVLRNIQAVSELSDLVRTSFGPNGMLKFFEDLQVL